MPREPQRLQTCSRGDRVASPVSFEVRDPGVPRAAVTFDDQRPGWDHGIDTLCPGLTAGERRYGVAQTKEVMWSQLEIGSLQAGIDLESRTQLLASQTGQLAEAMTAFLEKRPPAFD